MVWRSRYLLIPLLIFFLLFFGVLGVYTFQIFDKSSPVESFRTRLDGFFLREYNSRSIIGVVFHTYIFRNGDKYIFKPPRVIPSYTIPGEPAYTVYGLVEHWEPDTKLLTVNLYTSGRIRVSFDPTINGTIAHVPRLNVRGETVSFRDTDIVIRSDHIRFPTLFCTGDIIAMTIMKPNELKQAKVGLPLIPKEIKLSQRLCDQNAL